MASDATEWTGTPPWRVARPVMTQKWLDLTALHWRYDPEEVASKLPAGLKVDTFDDATWVGLIAFRMADIAARITPPIPYLGSFPETNVRSYVVGPAGPGVWFHSLDISRLLPVVVARATYRLPYMWSKMSIEPRNSRMEYRCRRRWPGPRGARSHMSVEVDEPLRPPSAFDHYLSARWGLYTVLGGRLAFARIEHEPWPLHAATVLGVEDELVVAAGFSAPHGPVHARYSPGVSLRIERPRFV